MDVDKLFKLPKVPQSSLNKRKWAEPSKATLQSLSSEERDQEEDDKVAGPSAGSRRRSKAARVSIADEDIEDDIEEDTVSFAPGNDADYFVDEDDDGGRFFGGGLTSQQKRILEIMNGADESQDGEDAGLRAEDQLRGFRKSLVKLERAINKNQEMRVRFVDDPSK